MAKQSYMIICRTDTDFIRQYEVRKCKFSPSIFSYQPPIQEVGEYVEAFDTIAGAEMHIKGLWRLEDEKETRQATGLSDEFKRKILDALEDMIEKL